MNIKQQVHKQQQLTVKIKKDKGQLGNKETQYSRQINEVYCMLKQMIGELLWTVD